MISVLLSAILVLILVEGAVLAWYHASTGRGIAPRDMVPNFAAGFFLVAAAREALRLGGDPAGTPLPMLLCLSLALAAHVIDVARRWKR